MKWFFRIVWGFNILLWGGMGVLLVYNHFEYLRGDIGPCHQGMTLGPGQSCDLRLGPSREG